MKRSEAARYARWSALLALALIALTAGIYLQRQWTVHLEKKKAPAATPRDVERQSSSLTFSKVEANRTIFTVQASKSTDFKGQDASLLEEVTITVFGKSGERNDIIHTQSCKYAKADGGIQCSGNVLMELQSAVEAERVRKDPSAKPNLLRVETSGVTFERATGRAQTVQPVRFSFPNGSGEGLGAVYFSEEGQLRLIQDVHLTLRSTGVPGNPKTKQNEATEVNIEGSSLEIEKNSKTIVLHGPLQASTATRQLTAGELSISMDDQFHAQSLVASPGTEGHKVELASRTAKGKDVLRSQKLTARFSSEGWVEKVLAEGEVEGTSAAGSMEAREGELTMFPRMNHPKLLILRGNVRLQTQDVKTGMTRSLNTNALQVSFRDTPRRQSSQAQHAETLERGTAEWIDSSAARSKITADKLQLEFSALGKPQELTASGKVESVRQLKNGPVQSATASSGVAELEPGGEWSQIELHGGVHLNQGDRSAEGRDALFQKTSRTALLSGQAVARDGSSETRAAKIIFYQESGDIEANGSVHSVDRSAGRSAVDLSSAPSHIIADHMQVNSKTGRALYTGRARLWQGVSVLEADSIELLRTDKMLKAQGNVHGVFPQQSAVRPGQEQPPAGVQSKRQEIWHVSSDTLTYWDAENRARLETNVVVQSTEQRLRCLTLDLYFSRQTSAQDGNTHASQISRAVATGNVIVDQGERRGTADRGVYTAADQKFVLSGGSPMLYDPREGTTAGRELTFNIADDTIIVSSGNGSRTLTKHRVQR